MCVIAAAGDAPCQCFSPGSNQTTSPGRISSTEPPQRCAHPRPEVTINVWPNGCVCHAVRAPGSNVTLAPRTRAGSFASNSGSMRTVPVNQSAGPLLDFCEPDLFISIFRLPSSIFYQLIALSSMLQADSSQLLYCDRALSRERAGSRVCLKQFLKTRIISESIEVGIVFNPHPDLSADVRQHALEEIQSLLRIAKFGVATGQIVLGERIVGADH